MAYGLLTHAFESLLGAKCVRYICYINACTLCRFSGHVIMLVASLTGRNIILRNIILFSRSTLQYKIY